MDYAANVEEWGAEMCFCAAILGLKHPETVLIGHFSSRHSGPLKGERKGEGDNVGGMKLEEQGQHKKGKKIPPAEEMSLVVVRTYRTGPVSSDFIGEVTI